MGWRSFRVRDDRGEWRRVPYRVGAEKWAELTPEERSGIDAARDIQWLRHLSGSGVVLVLVWLAAGLLTVLMMGAVWGTDDPWDRPSPLVIVTLHLATGGVILGASFHRRYLRRLLARRQVRVVEEVPMCPACGYRLSGLVRGGDGCTVCPECGAAWRVGGGR